MVPTVDSTDDPAPATTPTSRGRGRPPLLTPERHHRLVELLRAGAFDWVAAETVGIGRRTFARWVTKGEADPDDPLYGPFALDVMQARAQARARAEVTIAETNPLVWLMRSGGRSKPGRPGWTELPAGVEARISEGQGKILAEIVAGVLTDLELSPERLVLARASFRRRVEEMKTTRFD